MKNIIYIIAFFTGLWYFVWYGKNTGHSELVAGVIACFCFGLCLKYLVDVLNYIKDKIYFGAVIDAFLVWYFFDIKIKLLRTISEPTSAEVMQYTPFGLNPHLVVPVFLAVMLGLAILLIYISKFIEWFSSLDNKITQDYYPGKLLLKRFKLRRNR